MTFMNVFEVLTSTSQTQEKSLYPKLLDLLRPISPENGANLLGWHAEGPFLQLAKKGAHASPFLRSAPERIATFEEVYGAANLAHKEDWLMNPTDDASTGVRIITAAPEIDGVMDTVKDLTERGIVFSIGHRSVFVFGSRHPS